MEILKTIALFLFMGSLIKISHVVFFNVINFKNKTTYEMDRENIIVTWVAVTYMLTFIISKI